MSIRPLTNEELQIIIALADTWNKFLELPDLDDADKSEFMQYIHFAQQAVAARPVFEAINEQLYLEIR